MKFNLTINDIEKEELGKVISALVCIDLGVKPDFTSSDDNEENLSECVCDTTALEENIANNKDEVVAFDAEGLPWDERIHSSNHKLTSQGVWVRRRGITDVEFNRVKTELLGVETPVAPVEETPVAVEAPVIETPVTPVVTPATLTAETPVTPVAPVVEEAPVDCAILYQEMFEKVKQGFATRTLDANYIQNVIATFNVTNGKSYKGLAEMKDDANALKFVINDLVAKGL